MSSKYNTRIFLVLYHRNFYGIILESFVDNTMFFFLHVRWQYLWPMRASEMNIFDDLSLAHIAPAGTQHHTRYVQKVSDLRLDYCFRLWGCCALRICSKRSDDQQRILRCSSEKIAWCRKKKTTAFLVKRWLASSPR